MSRATLPLLALSLVLVSVADAQERSTDRSEGRVDAELVVAVSSTGEEGGATRVGTIHVGRLSHGRPASLSYALDPSRCYVAVGRGGPGVANLDVDIRRGREVLARDADTGPAAVARYCTGDWRETVRVGVRPFRGAGRFAAALFVQPSEHGALGRAAIVEGESALARLASVVTQRGTGMSAVSAPAREELAEGQVIERSLPLAPGRCYRILAASESGIADLDLEVRGPAGTRLAADASDGPTPSIGVLSPFCPAAPGDHVLVLRVARGGGAFAWQALGSSAGGERARATDGRDAPRFRVGGTGTSYVASRVRARHGELAGGAAATTDLVLGTGRAGETAEHRFDVESGHCYRVLAAGVPSIHDLDLEVRDHLGDTRGEDRGEGSTPAVRACAAVSGRWTARVYVFSGYGQYGLQVFSADD